MTRLDERKPLMTTLLVRPRATQRAEQIRGGYLVQKAENPGLRRFYTQAELDRDFETLGIDVQEPAPRDLIWNAETGNFEREPLARTGTEE